MVEFFLLLAGVVLAAVGGEVFLKAVLGLSGWLRIPPAVTAATLAAFATSSPEIAVAVNAGLQGKGELAVGDALGSNIVNVALILGLVLCLGSLRFDWETHFREYLWAMATPYLVLLVLVDDFFSRADAALFLSLFGFWLFRVTSSALRQRTRQEPGNGGQAVSPWLPVFMGIAGMLLLSTAGKLIVLGASGIGESLGMSSFLIGATLVAFGTSAPELATALIARVRGHDEVGVGTILGSNVFNCLFVVGMTGLVGPFELQGRAVLPSILLGGTSLLLILPVSGNKLHRTRGYGLLGLYILSILVAWMESRS